MEQETSFCVICSAVIRKDVEESGGGDKTLSSLRCLLLKKCGDSVENTQFLEEILRKLEEAHYALCSECHLVTQGALESKARAEGLEVEVRQLQGKLLALLRGLQEEMEVFQQEMSKMEDIIMSRREKIEEEEGNGSVVTQREEADMVREEILEVVTELRFYQADLQDKLILNRVEGQSMLEVSLNEVEVDFVSEVRVESEEETCNISDLINYGEGNDLDENEHEKAEESDRILILGEEESDRILGEEEESDRILGEEEESDRILGVEETADWDASENNSRFVGHTVGLASEEEEEKEKNITKRRKLRRSFAWKEDLPFMCNLCGERIATQNKLTRHLKRIHGQFPGAEKAERFRKPAVRYNNEAVAEEILSKALVCMTKNVEEKDRNTKTRAERKKERQEKLVALRAQWKTLRKSIQKKNTQPVSVNLKRERKKQVPCQKEKVVLQKKCKTGKIRVHGNGTNKTSEELKTPASKVEDVTDAAVIASEDVKEVRPVPPPPVIKKKSKVSKPVKEQRQPLRRSTRGRCTLDMKDILTELVTKDHRKVKTTDLEITPETET